MNPRVLILCALSTSVVAEPSSTVNWLMNEPASMFDIGMMRLRDFNRNEWAPNLKEKLEPSFDSLDIEEFKSDSVVYNFDKNRISVEVSFLGYPSEKTCELILKQYKDSISPLRKRASKLAVTFFAGNFDHINYSNPGAPRNWREEIVNITNITVGIEEPINVDPDDAPDVQALKRLKGGKSLFCSGSLLSDELTYTKIGF